MGGSDRFPCSKKSTVRKISRGAECGITSRDWVAPGVDTSGCGMHTIRKSVECGVETFKVSWYNWSTSSKSFANIRSAIRGFRQYFDKYKAKFAVRAELSYQG